MCTVKTQKHRFPFAIYISTIIPNGAPLHVVETPQNTDHQHCFSIPCLLVLISHHFKPLTEIRTN